MGATAPPRAGSRIRGAIAVVGGLALLATAPAATRADDTYVDDDAATDTLPCTLAQPCQSIQTGIFDADPGDTTFVDGGDYGPVPLLLTDGQSLIEQDFSIIGQCQCVLVV